MKEIGQFKFINTYKEDFLTKTSTRSSNSYSIRNNMAISTAGYDNILRPFVIPGSSKSGYQKRHWHAMEDHDVIDGSDSSSLSSLQESCATKSSLNSSSSFTPSTTSSSDSRSTTRRSITRKSRRTRRRQLIKSMSPADVVFDPTRGPKKSSMKKCSAASSSSQQQRHGACGKRSTIQVYLPGKREPVQRQTSVHFKATVTLRTMQSTKSLAGNNLSVLWYQGDEQAETKKKIREIVSRVNSEGISITDGRKYCMRGLERFTNSHKCDLSIILSRDAVLLEQFLQRELNDYDPDLIASVYRQSTQKSRHLAKRRGSKDAIVAESILGIKRFHTSASIHEESSSRRSSRRSSSTRQGCTKSEVLSPPTTTLSTREPGERRYKHPSRGHSLSRKRLPSKKRQARGVGRSTSM
mmetsp:Transcript_9117/g.19740  ORF Transcript_9117/g.19740 Transcript_9117/m.19740 type:complete len:410 (-) Transcript_9117:193-1422(-)